MEEIICQLYKLLFSKKEPLKEPIFIGNKSWVILQDQLKLSDRCICQLFSIKDVVRFARKQKKNPHKTKMWPLRELRMFI